MSNPFPGMNPYLEDDLWSDFHFRLAIKLSAKISGFISKKYTALVEHYVVEDQSSLSISKKYQPDVSILKNDIVSESAMAMYGNRPVIKEADYRVPIDQPIEIRIPVIQIRDKKNRKLVTSIEILSPVNKRAPTIEKYRKKRKEMIAAKIHFLEIDLLRGGTRPVSHPIVENFDYLISLNRAGLYETELWTIDLTNILPVIPVPLAENDDDVPLDLQSAFNELFDEINYGDAIDYSQNVPPPKLSKKKKQWVEKILNENSIKTV